MYVCICCGAEVEKIYTQYSKEIINFQLCKICGRIVDKYVEYDFTIVAIDLLVCKIEAYRHILRNIEIPRLFHLLLLSCLLCGFLGWICTENFDNFDVNIINATVNSDLYSSILLKTLVTALSGFLLYSFGYIFGLNISVIGIVKLLVLTNLCSLIGLLMYPWKNILLDFLPYTSVYFSPILTFVCTLPTTIPSFRALTNASYTLSLIIPLISCSLVFVIESSVIKDRPF
ncbi:unnamed protein product [Rodentolepis nana]|uniref:Protein ARV n=1 Tax=Rodentolepis nana TaxID=102285 RepID=A0A0R3TWN5_RODNA|nr:unnamed protein product [Rodentolepis nana]